VITAQKNLKSFYCLRLRSLKKARLLNMLNHYLVEIITESSVANYIIRAETEREAIQRLKKELSSEPLNRLNTYRRYNIRATDVRALPSLSLVDIRTLS
jgi:hypothetical protein